MVLPAWWVRAFDAASNNRLNGYGRIPQALSAQLAPALLPSELAILAMVLNQAQKQLLQNASSLRISLAELVKHSGMTTRSRRAILERTLQELSGLRLLQPKYCGEIWEPQPFFSSEVWQVHETEDLIFELMPSPLGADLILGVSDLYVELLQQTLNPRGIKQVQKLPLTVWRSVWLELSGRDLELFLRLEKAMQWDGAYIDLEGRFALAIDDLFHGQKPSGLPGRLRQLQRLGKRLELHGYLSGWHDQRFLAFGSEFDDKLSLVWQIGRDRRTLSATKQHISAVADWNLRVRLEPHLPHLLKIFAPNASDQEKGLSLARRLLSQKAPPEVIWALCNGSSGILSPHLLFLEYVLRAKSSGEQGLPEAMRLTPLIELVEQQNEEGIEERFSRFCDLVLGMPEFIKNLLTIPRATLSINKGCEDWSELTRKEATFEASPQARPHSPEPMRKDEPPKSTSVGDKSGGSEPHAVTRMQKTASAELARLRSSDPSKYAALKRAYFDSLDEGARNMMLDVQRQLEPTKFEEQLRSRLVRFMIDHPGAWSSGTSMGQGLRV